MSRIILEHGNDRNAWLIELPDGIMWLLELSGGIKWLLELSDPCGCSVDNLERVVWVIVLVASFL